MRAYTALGLWLCAPAALFAASPGTTSADFLKIGPAPRPVALGGAYVSASAGVDGIPYNPAGLGLLERPQVGLMHNEFLEGVRQEYAAFALPTEEAGTFGLSLNLVQIEPFEAYDINDVPNGKVSAQDTAVSAAWGLAVEIPHRGLVAFGVSGKYLHSRLASSGARGRAVDGGVLWLSGRRGEERQVFGVGASLQNQGPDMKFERDGAPLPRSWRAGASLQRQLRWAGSHVLFCVDAGGAVDRSPFPLLGVEVGWAEYGALRLGYRGDQDAGSGLSLGFGIPVLRQGYSWLSLSEYPEGVPDMDLEYAFVDHGRLGPTHRIGLTMHFGRLRPGGTVR